MSDFVRELLAEETRKFLSEKKITQTDFSKRYGCTQSYLSRMLSCSRPFEKDKIEKAIASYNSRLITHIVIEDEDDISNLENNIKKLFEITEPIQ